MLQRLIVICTLCLPLLTASPGEGGEQAPGDAQETDAQQLRALGEAEKKLAALASLPAQETAAAKHGQPNKQKKALPRRKKAHKRAQHASSHNDSKAEGGRLTMSEVKAILAGTRDLSGADLTGLDLGGMDLSGVNFSRADLSRANLSTADLSEADLMLADLTNANFTRASLRMARLHGTRTWGARFDGAVWVDRTVCRSGSLGRCRE